MLEYVQMSKLTLSMDDAVISRAKRYAKTHGTSVSKLVETYLASVAGSERQSSGDTPILRTIRGLLRRADMKDYKKHLAAKYR